jgi:hypothetical protein
MPARTPSVIRGRELLRVVVLSGLAGASAVDYHGRPLSDWGVLTTDYENGVEGCECLTDVRARVDELMADSRGSVVERRIGVSVTRFVTDKSTDETSS